MDPILLIGSEFFLKIVCKKKNISKVILLYNNKSLETFYLIFVFFGSFLAYVCKIKLPASDRGYI